jgi:putative pyruvate formate lyase activating enzyme
MPGYINDTRSIMRFLSDDVSRDMYINLMDQYRPAGKVSPSDYKEINRRLTGDEYHKALKAAQKAGLWRFDQCRPSFPWQ